MNWREFSKEGHWPTLLSAFLYFDVSFMVWVVLGPLSLYLSQDLGLSIEEKFSIVAIPILAGALLRVPLGMLADHIGPKLTGIIAQIIVILGFIHRALRPIPRAVAGSIVSSHIGMAAKAAHKKAHWSENSVKQS